MGDKPSQWFVDHGGKTHGPFTSSQLKQLAATKKINPDTRVRLGIDGSWTTARHVKGLFESKELVPVVKAVSAASVRTSPVIVQSRSIARGRIPCPFCGEEIVDTAVKCRFCNEFLDGRQSGPPMQQVYVAPTAAPSVNVQVVQRVTLPAQRQWSPGVAMVLSFIIPGMGQMYKGQLFSGIVWFFVTFIGYLCFVIPGLVLHLCCIVGAGMGNPYR